MKNNISNHGFGVDTAHAPQFNRIVLLLTAVGTGVCLITLFLLQSMTTYTTDDYYYASFCNGSIADFINANIEHYQTRNGRVFVHIAAELLLGVGFTAFSIVTLLLLGLICVVFMRIQLSARLTSRPIQYLTAGFIFSVLLLLPSYNVLRSGLLCVSDVCNYILPFALLSSAFGLLHKASGHVAAKVLTVFLFFLSGASTEQGGVMTMVLLILYLLHSLGKDKSKALPLCICLCCTAIGFFTIFLSPATQTRVSDEFSLATMLNGLQSVACNFAAPRRLMPVMLIFYLCVFLLTILKKETPRALWISLPLLCLTICSCFLGQSVAVNTFNFVVFCIFVLVASLLLIFRTPYLHSGCILLAGLASVLMIAVTASGSIRTCIPFMLSLILTSSFFIAEIFSVSVQNGKTYQKATRITAILVLTCVTVLRTLPTLSGVHENYKILTENENAVEAARSTGVLRYEEYAPYYSLCDMFNGTVFEATFRDKYQLYTEEIEYHVTSSDMYNASCPTIIRNTKIYYNLRSMLTLHGGSLRWMANDYLFIYYNNETFLYDAPYFCSLSTNTYRDAGDSFFVYDNSTYVSEELLGWLGIELN